MTSRLVHLVRHGETEGESSIRYWGRTDVALSEFGRAQIRRLGALIAERPVAAVVHSPLARAAESAQLLVAALRSTPPVVEAEPGLAEVDFGALEGLTEPEIRAAHPEWHAVWRRGDAEAYPGGEGIAAFVARVVAAFEVVLERHPAGDLLVVVHRGVIRHALARLLGPAAHQRHDLGVDLASVTTVRTGPVPELVAVNVRAET
ncbi:MAG: histidine phosphatase family protein [Planctomycetota bacterium]